MQLYVHWQPDLIIMQLCVTWRCSKALTHAWAACSQSVLCCIVCFISFLKSISESRRTATVIFHLIHTLISYDNTELHSLLYLISKENQLKQNDPVIEVSFTDPAAVMDAFHAAVWCTNYSLWARIWLVLVFSFLVQWERQPPLQRMKCFTLVMCCLSESLHRDSSRAGNHFIVLHLLQNL